MGRTGYAVTLAVILTLAAGAYYFYREEGPAARPAPAAPAPPAVLTMAGTEMKEEQDGKILWQMTADSIDVDPDTKQARFHNVHGTFYQADGNTLELTGLEGTFDSKSRVAVIEGDVRAKDLTGGSFAAPKVEWMANERHFRGTGGTKVIKDGRIFTGDTMECDVDLKAIHLQGHASVRTGE